MKGNRNDTGVSPVMGTILMVAVTVLLAAIIAAYVFGMPVNVSKNSVIGATAQEVNGDIIITYQGGPDAYKCDTIVWTVSDDNDDPQEHTMGTAGGDPLTVGTTYEFEATTSAGYAQANHLVAVAHFLDGHDQVIFDSIL